MKKLGPVYYWKNNHWITGIAISLDEVEKLTQSIDKLNTLKSIRSDYSSENTFSLPFPRKLIRVDFVGVNLNNLVTKQDVVKCRMIYNDSDGSFFDKPIDLSYQGSSSMAYAKKNFAMDILNEDGSSCDIKIGDWPVMDSYNFKANFIDFTQSRNVTIARLAYQAACTRPYGQRFGWELPYSPGVTSLRDRFDDGSRGTIDGFPMELFINGEYWGLYTFNIKKTRKNFNMKKGEDIKIIMGAETHNSYIDFYESQWDFKNPDPVTPVTLEKVRRLFTWQRDIDRGRADFLSTYKDYWLKDQWIDYFIFITLFYAPDCYWKNGMLCTWDGDRWAFMLYDLDTTFGVQNYELDAKRWPIIPSNGNYCYTGINQLMDWYQKRCQYVDSQWLISND